MPQKNTTLTRGARNNNPLNIRIGNVWLGEVMNPTDNEFEQFVSMFYGLRAAFILLRRYIRRYKLNTIALVISRWSPSNENNTTAYINKVADLMKIDPSQPITYEDEKTMVNLVWSMAIIESNIRLDKDLISQAYRKS